MEPDIVATLETKLLRIATNVLFHKEFQIIRIENEVRDGDGVALLMRPYVNY